MVSVPDAIGPLHKSGIGQRIPTNKSALRCANVKQGESRMLMSSLFGVYDSFYTPRDTKYRGSGGMKNKKPTPRKTRVAKRKAQRRARRQHR